MHDVGLEVHGTDLDPVVLMRVVFFTPKVAAIISAPRTGIFVFEV